MGGPGKGREKKMDKFLTFNKKNIIKIKMRIERAINFLSLENKSTHPSAEKSRKNDLFFFFFFFPSPKINYKNFGISVEKFLINLIYSSFSWSKSAEAINLSL
jgi:hypothetical protein